MGLLHTVVKNKKKKTTIFSINSEEGMIFPPLFQTGKESYLVPRGELGVGAAATLLEGK